MYRTEHVNVSKISYMYQYFADICENAEALYNRANFLVRQYATAMDAFKKMQPLHKNQMEAYNLIYDILKGHKYYPRGKWLSYNALDYILKKSHNPAYYNLPAQVNQQVLKMLDRDYTSYFESLESWKENPELFKAMPKMPKYTKQPKTAVFTNQVSSIQLNGNGFPVLKFPLTEDTFRILNIPSDAVLKEVRVKPIGNRFRMGIVYEIPDKGISISKDKQILKDLRKIKSLDDLRVLSIDPGVDNLCTITNNYGQKPVIIKGTVLKSINQFYNKQIAELKSIAMTCNNRYQTAHMSAVTNKRNMRVYDLMHKISRIITDMAVRDHVDFVVMGHNVFQKQDVSIGHVNNQNFVQLPFSVLSDMLRYKLSECGITFVQTEESHTSKADFIACDKIPVYKKPKPEDDGSKPKKQKTYKFSGTRIKRGLYRHGDGTISNADVNGSANIMRKVFPKVRQWDRGIVDMPCVVMRLAA